MSESDSEPFRCTDCPAEFIEQRNASCHIRFCHEVLRRQESEANLAKGPSRASKRPKGPSCTRTSKRARYDNPPSEPPEPDLGANEDTPTVTDIAPDTEAMPAPESPPASISFSGRRRRVPRALRDYIPHSLVGLPSHLRPAPPAASPKPTTPPAEEEVPNPEPGPDSDDAEPEPDTSTEFTTEPNGFGLYRRYTRKPRTDPEDNLTLTDLADDTMPEEHPTDAAGPGTRTEAPRTTTVDFFHPFPNATVFRCIKWFLGVSGTVSAGDFDRLVREIILSDDFKRDDLQNFSTTRELARLDTHGSTSVPFAAKDGWKQGSVTLHVPNTKSKYASESASPEFCVSGIWYRPLMEVIKTACQSSQAKSHHWVPFTLVHQSPSAHVRAYTDIYNSDAMLEEDAKIRALGRHPEDDPDTEVAILAMLLWSDSTHLATFGTASVWPIYLYFGNLSKYARGRPNARAAHHMAYIPSVGLDSDPHSQTD